MALTTATSVTKHDFATNRVTQFLVLMCAVVWVWAAYDPVYRFDWFLENILVFVGVGLIVWLYKKCPLSDVSYALMAVFFCLHVAGSHYTYSEVPWGQWAKEAFDMERNHYDRLVHFSFGLLLAYPIREFLIRGVKLRGFAAYFFAFTIVVAMSDIFEIIEFLVASIVNPEAGTAYLGTQGDPFDAQKDTALALIGSVVALILTWAKERGARYE